MNSTGPAPSAQGSGPSCPLPGLLSRACLQALAGLDAEPQEVRISARVEQARLRSRLGAQTQQRLDAARSESAAGRRRLFLARVEWLALAQDLEQRELGGAGGPEAAEALLESRGAEWPGKRLGPSYLAQYRLVPRYLPDELLYSETGTPHLKLQLARLRSPLCIEYLGGLMLHGEKTRLLNLGRQAAWEALLPSQRGGPIAPAAEERALRAAIRAITEPGKPRGKGSQAGEQRRTPREVPQQQEEAAGDPLKGLSDEPAASEEPAKGLSDEPAASEEPAKGLSQQPERPYVEPPRPYVDPLGEGVLPVPAHRSLLGKMTRAERLTYRILALGHSVTSLLTQWARRRREDHELTALDLQLLVYYRVGESRELLPAFSRLFQPAIARARAAELQDPDEPIDRLLEWVLFENADPLHSPDPNASEQMLFAVLGQLPRLHQDLGDLMALRQQGGPEAGIDLRLLCRLGEQMEGLQDVIVRTSARLSMGAKAAHEAQQAAAAQQAALEAVNGTRGPRLLVVGAEALPPAYGLVAKTLDDRLLAWNLWEPSFTFLLGDRGKGKSHFIRVLMELLTLRPPGLCFLKGPQCPILLEADTLSGQGRFEMLQGFFANHDAGQLAYLRHYYRTDARNLAYKRGVLLCHPQMVPLYRKRLARYVERGLVIRPLALGIGDLGSFGFEVLLERAVGGDPHAVYKNLLSSLVAKHGERLRLSHLRQAVDQATLRSQTKHTLMALLDQLDTMYSETESLMQHVGDCPVFVVLRGRYLPRNFVNPLQAVLFNAFCRSTENGDPARMVILEEGLKALCGNGALHDFMVSFQEEGRHRPVSAVVAVQHVKGMGKGLWGAADQHVVFGLSDPEDWKAARAEHRGMGQASFEEMEAHGMPRGRARVWSRRGSSPELSRGLVVDIRPALIRAGGETVTLEDSEE